MSLNTRPEHSQAALQRWDNSSSCRASPEVTLVTATVSARPEKALPLKSDVDPVLSATSCQNSRANLIHTKAKPVQRTKAAFLDGEWEESFQDLSSWCSQPTNPCTMDAREPSCVIDDELNTPEIVHNEFDFVSRASEEVPRTPELNYGYDWNMMTTDMDVLGSFDALVNSSESDFIKDDETLLEDVPSLTFINNRDIINTQVIHDTFIEEPPTFIEEQPCEMSHEEVIDDTNNSECVIESEDISNSNSCFSVQQENIPIILTFVAAEDSATSLDSYSTYSPGKDMFAQLKEESQEGKEESCRWMSEYVNYDTKPSSHAKGEKRAFEETVEVDDSTKTTRNQFSPKPKMVRNETGGKAILDLKLNASSCFENVGISTPDVVDSLINSNGFNLLEYCIGGESPDLKQLDVVFPPVSKVPDLKQLDVVFPPVSKVPDLKQMDVVFPAVSSSTASETIVPTVKTEEIARNYKSTHTSKVKRVATKSTRATARRKSSVKLETINISDISDPIFPSLDSVPSTSTSTSTPITLKLRKRSGSQSKRNEEYEWEFDNISDNEDVFKPSRTKGIKLEPPSPKSIGNKRKLSSISELDDILPPKQRCSSSCSDNEFHNVGCSKYRELRDRNNEASRRSRQNRKSKEFQMSQLADHLERENQTLKIKADEMERLVKKMRDALLNAVLKSKKEK